MTGSCGSEASGEGVSRPVSAKAAQPSVGIGREMETKAPAVPVEPKNFTICVDPGHGFVDGGAGEGVFENGVLEKDITLAVSKLLVEDLENLGFKTIITHNGVDYPAADKNRNKIFSAMERSAYVNTLDIDYFVSIHVNAYDDPSVYGMQIYYEQNGKKVNDWSQTVADEIASSLEGTFPDYKTPTIWSDRT
ncbi:MAG: N-acetylmuramoyl-L-alanine amidase, partial [Clostridia bacterium]|nr:N-acetylmuramoyl-L-alanine amidase [Clostridia bacterium]